MFRFLCTSGYAHRQQYSLRVYRCFMIYFSNHEIIANICWVQQFNVVQNHTLDHKAEYRRSIVVVYFIRFMLCDNAQSNYSIERDFWRISSLHHQYAHQTSTELKVLVSCWWLLTKKSPFTVSINVATIASWHWIWLFGKNAFNRDFSNISAIGPISCWRINITRQQHYSSQRYVVQFDGKQFRNTTKT
jgi:hypothetical protein